MREAPGRELGDVIDGKPMPLDEAYRLLIQLLQALDFVHSRGYVHRDIKAANVRVTPDGTLKLMDFGLMGQIGQASYSASKGGVVGMTLPIARDLAAIGVRVNTVAPGLIDTPIYGEGDNSEAFKANLQKGVLFPQRLGLPEELASVVIECVTNSYLNAETIRVDGGIRMPPK